jgi:phosphoenolpyruvate carboxykinase (ATP)
VYLLNTGWTGGPAGVGRRINLPYTREMVRAALAGRLDDVDTYIDSSFGLHVPTHIPGVPDELLHPRTTWGNPEAYDDKARDLAHRFVENFEQFAQAGPEVVAAGPRV